MSLDTVRTTSDNAVIAKDVSSTKTNSNPAATTQSIGNELQKYMDSIMAKQREDREKKFIIIKQAFTYIMNMTFTYQPVQTKYIGLMAVLHHLLVSEYLPLANSIPEQSSTLNNNTGARRALDGVNGTGFVHNNGCSHTAEVVGELSWWRVMLDKPAMLKSVAVLQGNLGFSTSEYEH